MVYPKRSADDPEGILDFVIEAVGWQVGESRRDGSQQFQGSPSHEMTRSITSPLLRILLLRILAIFVF